MTRTQRIEDVLPQIVEAGLLGDRQAMELLVLTTIRSIRKDLPELSKQLSSLMALHREGPSVLRWKGAAPPSNDDEGMSLLKIEQVNGAQMPVLSSDIVESVEQFVQQRRASSHLASEGFAPPRSVLLLGSPGTGKTTLARWVASSLQLPLVSLDLATSISSFLGKTGFNLRRSLDYARSSPCVFLLDEFDAIAKRRDDAGEVGELKRIVNVLLKELEHWPTHSVLIAATNHSELLDPAIRRRFDVTLSLPLPGAAEREAILRRIGGRFAESCSDDVLKTCAALCEKVSGSELESLMNAAVRRHLTAGEDFQTSLFTELARRVLDGNAERGEVIRMLQSTSGDGFSVRELARMFKLSPSTVQYHLKKGDADG